MQLAEATYVCTIVERSQRQNDETSKELTEGASFWANRGELKY